MKQLKKEAKKIVYLRIASKESGLILKTPRFGNGFTKLLELHKMGPQDLGSSLTLQHKHQECMIAKLDSVSSIKAYFLYG